MAQVHVKTEAKPGQDSFSALLNPNFIKVPVKSLVILRGLSFFMRPIKAKLTYEAKNLTTTHSVYSL